MTKASEIISQSCCGQMLDVPVFELVKKVKALELQIKILEEAVLDESLHKQSAYESLKDINNG